MTAASLYNAVLLYGVFLISSAVIYIASVFISHRRVQGPNFYILMITAALLPFAVMGVLELSPKEHVPSISLEMFAVTDLKAALENTGLNSAAHVSLLEGLFIAHILISLYFISKICVQMISLWRLGPIKDGIITTDKVISPACLPWPRRAVLLPQSLSPDARRQVLAHERAHQKYYDAEITLALCILSALFWLNWPLKQLIHQWRFAIEMRADHDALTHAPKGLRKDYAALLLQQISAESQQAKRRNRHRGARPCPSMALIPDQKRRTEMRLKAILNASASKNKGQWARGAAFTALILSLGGGVGLSALANDGEDTAQSDQEAVVSIRPIKTVPPIFPKDCIPEINPPVVNVTSEGRESHGWVKVRFDINESGEPVGIDAFESSKPCFEANSIAAVKQWRFEPVTQPQEGNKTRSAEYMLAFTQTSE